jgi:hypothetical protein
MAKNTVSQVVEIPEPPGIFGNRLLERGNEFFRSFEILCGDEKNVHAAYFLLAHSLELLLKSYLAARGLPKNKLFGLNHRLRAIYSACEKQALPYVEKLNLLVNHIAKMNSNHDFRYPTAYNLSLPYSQECIEVVRDLIQVVEPTVRRENLKASLRFHSKYRGKKVTWSD